MSTDYILQNFDIYLENKARETLPRFLLIIRSFSTFRAKGNFEWAF